KEIKTLITDSAVKVRHGNVLVDQAGRTMGEIVTSIKRVADIIADITAASQEQSAGIHQVNRPVAQMDGGRPQDAALREEATAAARSMEQQAGQLVDTVAVFSTQGAVDTPEAGVPVAGLGAGYARGARRTAAAAPAKPVEVPA